MSDLSIAELWESQDRQLWEKALGEYGQYLRPENVELEDKLEHLELEQLRLLNADEWYAFLRDEYFRWKYTDARRYKTTTRQLRRHEDDLAELDDIRTQLLAWDGNDAARPLLTALEINGLGPAGASGLLSLMYPEDFGTCDQFVVKSLRTVPGLPEGRRLAKMNAETLSISDSLLLIDLMRRKAMELGSPWTPRMVDKVLWTLGHRE